MFTDKITIRLNESKKYFASVAEEIAKDDRKVTIGLIYTVGAVVVTTAIAIPVTYASVKAVSVAGDVIGGLLSACCKKSAEPEPTEPGQTEERPNVCPATWEKRDDVPME